MEKIEEFINYIKTLSFEEQKKFLNVFCEEINNLSLTNSNTEQISEMPYIEDINLKLKLKSKYNPKFGDDKECACGHAYYRHFDSYENMASVGCKYCSCGTFILPEQINSILQKFLNKEISLETAENELNILAGFKKYLILTKIWNESSEDKTGWESSEWNEPENFEIDKILDTDKYSHSTIALFKYIY